MYFALSYMSKQMFLKLHSQALVQPHMTLTLCSRERTVCQPTVCTSVIARPSSWLMFLSNFFPISYLSHGFYKSLEGFCTWYHTIMTSPEVLYGVAHMVYRFGRTQPGFISHEPCTSEVSICTVFADTSLLSNLPSFPKVLTLVI